MAKKIIVLMSTYNGERYLVEQIESILNQEGCQVELLVRDDMSTDNTTSILDQYKKKGKLQWFNDNTNLGPAKSFFSLILQATDAGFYAFADQDDVWYKDKLIRGIEKIGDTNRPVVYYANAELVDKELTLTGDKVYRTNQLQSAVKGLCSCNALGCTMIFNHKVKEIVAAGGMPDKLIMHDNYVCGACIAAGGYIIYDHTAVIMYRQHGNNVVGAKGKMSVAKWIKSKVQFLHNGNKVSVSEQCGEFLKRIECDDKVVKLVKEISVYNEKWYRRIGLASQLLWLTMRRKASRHELVVAIGILLGNK